MNKYSIGVCLWICLGFFSCSNNNGENKNASGSSALLQKYEICNDGTQLTTNGIQSAIDDCARIGGGTVSLPAGQYLTGTIKLRSKVVLNLEKGAILHGSKNIKDYLGIGRKLALIYGENLTEVSITGDGEINGNGQAYNKGNDAPNRPTLVLLLDCKKVKVENVKLSNSAFWTFRFVGCDGVDISKVSVEGHANWNNDGFDIESRNVTISDCIIDTDDDAICFKSENPNFVVENVVVKNCDLASNCNYIKFGTASSGGFRNIKVSDCNLHKCNKSLLRFWEQRVPGVTNPITGIAGVALEVVDGGFMEDVTISNLTMEDVQTPVFIRLGRRKVSANSYLKNVLIEKIIATSVSYVASSITGVPGLRVDNVEIRDVDFKLKAGGKVADAMVNVPEVEDQYPENRMFGVMLPAYGFYIRHADHIKFTNMKLSFIGGKEERHAIYAEDVNGLDIINPSFQSPDSELPIVHMK